MVELTPIPIPLKQSWRYFRTRFMPFLVFGAAVTATAVLWERKSAPALMTGEVYAPQGPVLSPVSGTIEDFAAQPYQEVRAGEVVGSVRMVPVPHAQAELAALRAEIELIRIGAGDPVLDQQRNMLSWQGLRRDWMLARSDLASLKVRLAQAKVDYHRFEKLAGRGAESQAISEQSRALYESLAAEETEKRRLVDDLEQAVNESSTANGSGGSLGDGLKASLDWKDAELRNLETRLEPLPIVAPFDGRITLIHRRQGDFVNAGDPVVDIRAARPDFIIGYVKQPFSAPLEIGMEIEVAQRSARPSVGMANLVSIGPQFEPLAPAFVRPLAVMMEERALPLLISLPKGLVLRPGEIVDLRLRTPGS